MHFRKAVAIMKKTNTAVGSPVPLGMALVNGNAVQIRSSPLYCKEDECAAMSLPSMPGGKTRRRMTPSQETSQQAVCPFFRRGKMNSRDHAARALPASGERSFCEKLHFKAMFSAAYCRHFPGGGSSQRRVSPGYRRSCSSRLARSSLHKKVVSCSVSGVPRGAGGGQW